MLAGILRIVEVFSACAAALYLIGRVVLPIWRHLRLKLLWRSVLMAMILLPSMTNAANHYVRAGAAGTSDGSDWTNACTDFTGSCAVSSLVRGDTYYVASGTYAGRTFDTATSGTLVITIKGATVADHGTSTGWVNTYSVSTADGGSQAVWSHRSPTTIELYNSYFVFDGAVGSLSTTKTDYGFKVSGPTCPAGHQGFDVWGPSGIATNITIKHITYTGCTSVGDIGLEAIQVGCGACHLDTITISDSLFSDMSRVVDFSNVNNIVYERNISQGQWSSAANHGETISFNNNNAPAESVNGTVRYSQFLSSEGTATIACGLFGEGNACEGLKVYGNLFMNKVDGGNGIIATGSSGFAYLRNVLVYNNTFLRNDAQLMWLCSGDCANSTGNEFKNNFVYDSAATIDSGTGSITSDSNRFYNISSGAAFGTNQQTTTGGACPFVSCTAPYNLRLLSATNAGTSLASPYNVDPDGVTRGSDGTWDRGAYEFGSGGGSSPRVLLFIEWAALLLSIWNSRTILISGLASLSIACSYPRYALPYVQKTHCAVKDASARLIVACLRKENRGIS